MVQGKGHRKVWLRGAAAVQAVSSQCEPGEARVGADLVHHTRAHHRRPAPESSDPAEASEGGLRLQPLPPVRSLVPPPDHHALLAAPIMGDLCGDRVARPGGILDGEEVVGLRQVLLGKQRAQPDQIRWGLRHQEEPGGGDVEPMRNATGKPRRPVAVLLRSRREQPRQHAVACRIRVWWKDRHPRRLRHREAAGGLPENPRSVLRAHGIA